MRIQERWTESIEVIYRGPGFLAAPPPPPVSKLPHLFLSLPLCRRSSLLTGEGEGCGRGAESYDRKKAWPSIIRSLLSGVKGRSSFCTSDYVDPVSTVVSVSPRVVDPHLFKADSEPCFHCNADPDLAYTSESGAAHLSDGICNHWSMDPPGLSLQASTVSIHGPARLYFEPVKLLNFSIPDTAFHLMRIRIRLSKNMRAQPKIKPPPPPNLQLSSGNIMWTLLEIFGSFTSTVFSIIITIIRFNLT